MHKVDKDVPLTANEQAYLSQWTSTPSKESLLGQHAMVPEKPSSLRLDSITHKDLETLNGISQVEFSAERHGHFALNDLVVELAVFLDSDTVNRVDLTCFEHGMSQAWGLSPHELPVDLGTNSANKESALVRLELEELAWREAAKFTEDEGARILELTKVGRFDDALETRFKELDQESFYDFMGEVNEKDERIDLVENWLTRKEQEVMSRVNGVEGTDLDKTDQQIFNQLEAPLKRARQKIVASMLTHDEAGNALPQKSYENLTAKELHVIAENLSVRFNAFRQQGKVPEERYPPFLGPTVKAVLEHPHLANSDRHLLTTYSTLFELDWKGEQTIRSQAQFLCTNPVYLAPQPERQAVDNDAATQRLQQSSVPYIGPLTRKLFEMARQ